MTAAIDRHMEAERAADLHTMFEGDETESMTDLAARLWITKQQEKLAKEQYDGLKSERMEMEETLNAMMENEGVQSFRTDEATFYRREDIYANVKKENQDQFFDWLRSQGFGDLIYETVNHRTLSGFVRERMEEGGDDLPDYINVTVKKTVGTRKA